jgi:hypothetical protein
MTLKPNPDGLALIAQGIGAAVIPGRCAVSSRASLS